MVFFILCVGLFTNIEQGFLNAQKWMYAQILHLGEGGRRNGIQNCALLFINLFHVED